jgi:quercetin dioxygenase-like cupin family protein
MTDLTREVVFRTPGDSERLRVLGWELEVLVRAEQTGGRMGLIQGYFPAGVDGPPAHRDGHDELFLVLEGEMRFQIDENVVQAPAGTTIFIPEGTLHTFKNEAGAPARMMGAFLPGGYERYFEEIARLTNSATPPFSELAELAQRFGTTYVGPPVWRQAT